MFGDKRNIRFIRTVHTHGCQIQRKALRRPVRLIGFKKPPGRLLKHKQFGIGHSHVIHNLCLQTLVLPANLRKQHVILLQRSIISSALQQIIRFGFPAFPGAQSFISPDGLLNPRHHIRRIQIYIFQYDPRKSCRGTILVQQRVQGMRKLVQTTLFIQPLYQIPLHNLRIQHLCLLYQNIAQFLHGIYINIEFIYKIGLLGIFAGSQYNLTHFLCPSSYGTWKDSSHILPSDANNSPNPRSVTFTATRSGALIFMSKWYLL